MSTLEQTSISAVSVFNEKQLPDVVTQHDRLATLEDVQKCRLHESENDFLNMTFDKKLFYNHKETREASLQLEIGIFSCKTAASRTAGCMDL